MLNVILDARKLGDGGIGTYLQNLITGISRDPEVALEIIVGEGKSGTYFSEDLVAQREDASKPYSLDEQFLLGPRLCSPRGANLDIFHEPHFTLPMRLSCPAVVTIHDLIHLTNPEKWYYPTIARLLISSAITRAKRVIVVSTATQSALLKAFPKTPFLADKIRVIPNAVSEHFVREPTAWPQLLKDRFQLEPGYLFALFSMLKPHKGLSDLIEAYTRAKAQANLPPLVVAGWGLAQAASEESQVVKHLGQVGIRSLGDVTQDQLAALYKGARATVIPSLIEGFGLSALEAKVLGSPLVARPLPSLNAMIEKEDLVCEDMSVAALARALASIERLPVWQDRPWNQDLAARFSIQGVARQTIDVYREALSQA